MFEKTRTRSHRRDREPSVRRQILYGVLLCTVIVLVGVGVWHVTRLPSVTLSTVSLSGGETVKHATVQAVVDEVLLGDYLKLIPYRFFLMYPREKILNAVGEIDRIHTVLVEREGRNTLKISFTEYAPFALWCQNDSESSCFFLSETGYAFSPSPALHGNTLIRHMIEDMTELEEKQVFAEDRFRSTHAFLGTLTSDLGLRVTDVTYTKDGDITLGINGGGKIYMRNDGAYDEALRNLETILHSEAFDHLEPGNFQYIDIRFGNKIFVNEQLTPLDTATTTLETATTTVLGE